ncbi:MAG: phytoene desaturase family protein, partial [Haloglomus sp.]
PGGRAGRIEAEGFTFDTGPSWYLMPDVFERFFSHFDRSTEEFYDLERLDPHYRIFFKDGDRVDMVPDRDTNAETFESYAEGAGETFHDYLDTSEYHYETAMEQFVYEDRSSLRDFVDLDVMKAAPVGLKLLGTMEGYVSDYFDHPKLQQIMQYTLVFLGGAPKNTPALYNIMSHVDFNLGVYYPDGGIGAVVDALVELGGELGVTYETGAPVEEIITRREGFELVVGETAGVGLPTRTEGGSDAETAAGDPPEATAADGGAAADGTSGGASDAEAAQRRLPFDYVVSDADYAHTEQELLPEHERGYDASYWDSRTYAPSAFLLYMGVEGDVDPLEHHTLVLPTDWDDHFEQIFDDPAWPDDPAYYVCVPSETDSSVAPEGHSNLFVLVPIAPDLEDDPETRETYRELVLDDLAANTGVDLRDRIVFEESFSVSEFADRYNSMQGTALGMAHTLRQTAFLRPPHRSKEVEGLYFTGSYTTPGIGVPMCLVSGQHTADCVIEDLADSAPDR